MALAASPLAEAVPVYTCGTLWHTNCPQLVYPPHFCHDDHPSLTDRRSAAMSTETPDMVLESLIYDQDDLVRKWVAERVQSPMAMSVLAVDSDIDVRWTVAQNDYISSDLLVDLIVDPQSTVRMAAAGNQRLPVPVLLSLFDDPEPEVRWWAAGNPALPVEKLVELVVDQDIEVRMSVALHPDTPPSSLAVLAHDESSVVRESAATNVHTPSSSLVTLLGDEDDDVRRQARLNPHLPEHLRSVVVLSGERRTINP